jgi:hypothetical protein
MIPDFLFQVFTGYFVVLFLDVHTFFPLLFESTLYLEKLGLTQMRALLDFMAIAHDLSGKGQTGGLATIATVCGWQSFVEINGSQAHQVSPVHLFFLLKGLSLPALWALLRFTSTLFLMTTGATLESSHFFTSPTYSPHQPFLA